MKQFDRKERKHENFGFFGMRIITMADRFFEMHQSHYFKSMTAIKLSLGVDQFRRVRALLAWMTHT